MNAPVTVLAPTVIEGEVDALIGRLFDAQSKRRIIHAWRSGRISADKAAMLIKECGLEDVG